MRANWDIFLLINQTQSTILIITFTTCLLISPHVTSITIYRHYGLKILATIGKVLHYRLLYSLCLIKQIIQMTIY